MNNALKQKWHQEPWAWFMFILFLSAISAAIYMSYVAINRAPPEIGHHRFTDGILAKRERVQAKILKRIGLNANLFIAANGTVTVTLDRIKLPLTKVEQDLINPDTLKLNFEHPLYPNLDKVIHVRKDESGKYMGKIKGALSGKYYLMISPPNNMWYLTQSTFFPTQTGIKLTPGIT